MSRGIPKKTKQLTISALLSAMGIALLFIGMIIETLDLTMAALTSFFCIFAVIEIGGAFPWLIYSVTGVLAVILMPQSLSGWFYLLFFGYYPIIKERIEKLKKPVCWTLKVIILNLALALSVLAAYLLFFGQTDSKSLLDAFTLVFGESDAGEFTAIAVYVLANVTFIVYDIALTKLITVYFLKIKPKLKGINLK